MSNKNKAFTFGNMNAVQTRNAMHYIWNSDLSSEEIADVVSKYKSSPKVATTTISHLRTYVAKHYN